MYGNSNNLCVDTVFRFKSFKENGGRRTLEMVINRRQRNLIRYVLRFIVQLKILTERTMKTRRRDVEEV